MKIKIEIDYEKAVYENIINETNDSGVIKFTKDDDITIYPIYKDNANFIDEISNNLDKIELIFEFIYDTSVIVLAQWIINKIENNDKKIVYLGGKKYNLNSKKEVKKLRKKLKSYLK